MVKIERSPVKSKFIRFPYTYFREKFENHSKSKVSFS